MTVNELIKQLTLITKSEGGEMEVLGWVPGTYISFNYAFVGMDSKEESKPRCVLLEGDVKPGGLLS